MEVILFVGLQGSGKSTFYRTHFGSTHVLVSKDLFRNNRRPQRRQMQLIEDALKSNDSVVVDNTNVMVEDRAPIIALAKQYHANVIGYFFDGPIAECVERNRRRTGKARVPDAALYIALRRLRRPTLDEGFNELLRVTLSANGEYSVEEYREEEPR
jgi:predicted kinase